MLPLQPLLLMLLLHPLVGPRRTMLPTWESLHAPKHLADNTFEMLGIVIQRQAMLSLTRHARNPALQRQDNCQHARAAHMG